MITTTTRRLLPRTLRAYSHPHHQLRFATSQPTPPNPSSSSSSSFTFSGAPLPNQSTAPPPSGIVSTTSIPSHTSSASSSSSIHPTAANGSNSNSSSSSSATTNPTNHQEKPENLLPPLTQKQRDFLDQALRVNQAGELGANLIYHGQHTVLTRTSPHLTPLITHMWQQEIHHLTTFDALLAQHRVRPTALRPLWNVAGYLLGVGTAVLGEKAAMACTEAVETEIGGHYNDQVRVLLGMVRDLEAEGGVGGKGEVGELRGLLETIRKFRDEELEHLDTAVDHDSKGAEGYEVLTNVIRGGCKAAIWLSSRI